LTAPHAWSGYWHNFTNPSGCAIPISQVSKLTRKPGAGRRWWARGRFPLHNSAPSRVESPTPCAFGEPREADCAGRYQRHELDIHLGSRGWSCRGDSSLGTGRL